MSVPIVVDTGDVEVEVMPKTDCSSLNAALSVELEDSAWVCCCTR